MPGAGHVSPDEGIGLSAPHSAQRSLPALGFGKSTLKNQDNF